MLKEPMVAGIYWDFETGEEAIYLDPVIVTADRNNLEYWVREHGEGITQTALGAGLDYRSKGYVGTVLSVGWDMGKDSNIDVYGIRGVYYREVINVGSAVLYTVATRNTGAVMGAAGSYEYSLFVGDVKDKLVPALTPEEAKKQNDKIFKDAPNRMD